MDHPPPPPLFHHHQRLVYGNFLHPPGFIPNPYTHHLPPPPPPQARQSHILLAPHPLTTRHTAHPPLPTGLNVFPPRHPILYRSHPYEVNLPPKPYILRNFPHPPPPETRIHMRPVQGFCEHDEVVRQGHSDSYVRILAESRDRQMNWGARELRSGVPDIGDHKRYQDNFRSSSELYNIRDNINRRWDNQINGCGRYFDDEREYDMKRGDSIMNSRGSELYKKMDYDETRRDSINGWIRGLYKDKDSEGVDDERRLNHGTNDAVLLRLGNRQPGFMENGSSFGKLSGRLGSRVSDVEIVTSKKRKVQKEIATNMIQLRKKCGRDNGGNKCWHVAKESNGSSFKGKENEASECLQTRKDSKREDSVELAIPFKSDAHVAKAILAPACPASKIDINSTIVNSKLTYSTPCSPTAKSNKNVCKPEILECALGLPSDSLGASKELLDKSLVSENGSVIGAADDLGVITVTNQPQKDMNLQGPTVVESGNTRRDRSRSKKKARKKLLHETSMQMRKDSVAITSANDSNISLVFSQPCSDTNGVDEVAVNNQPQKDMNVEGRKKRKARNKLLLETSILMRKDSGHSINANDGIIPLAYSDGNGLGEIAVKNPPTKDMNLEDPTIGSVSTRQKKKKARKQSLYKTNLKMRMDRSHIIEGNDVSGLSQEDRCFSEIPTLNPSSQSDSALPLKPENVINSDVGSVDANSTEGFRNEVSIPQNVDSEKTRSPIGDNVSVEASLEGISNAKNCSSVDYLSNFTWKRKAEGAQTEIFGSNVVSVSSTSGEVGIFLAKDLVPSSGIAFLGERGSSKEDDNSNEGPFSKKMKVSSPRTNVSSFLEDKKVQDGLNGDWSKLYKQFTGLAERKYEKREDLSFSRNTEPSVCQPETKMIFGGGDISKKKPVSSDLTLFSSRKSLEKAISVNSQINAKLSRTLSVTNGEVVNNLNLLHGNQNLSKNQWSSASPKAFPGHHPLYVSNSRKLQTTHVAKSRTWRRDGNSSVAVTEIKSKPTILPQSQGTNTGRTIQSSYIRNGNSLVRNPSPSAVSSGFHNSSRLVYRLSPSADNFKNNQASDANAQSITRTEQVNTWEMPFKTIDALKEHMKSHEFFECRPESGSSYSSQSMLKDGNPDKKITYVKRRCNQLIASSDPDMSTSGIDKSQALSSDGYYKKKKNQLVRGTSVKEVDANGNSNRLVSRTSLPRTCTRRPSGIPKHLKFSFVWKLHDMQSSEQHKTPVGPQKVFPHMFSWKRATNWRTFKHALSMKPRLSKSSFGAGGQSLLLSRKRGAVYTRSTRGYSLRMSKVLSVGGSSLKWSKSIERSSKKASEEATRAVAAAEKRKKEENGAVPIASKSRNNVSRKLVHNVQLRPGERIFRIGSERYKMDPTRRTLHRITADKEALPSALQTEKNVKRCYVPRRLLIGNEEYVRIGNGNQLVRDPKKRTRVLASEKIRWSLRTARLRLARKRMYCQFFTRFGKCNKNDGKCPYIHDPSKIAVCTKFLKDLCTNVDCKLTHKVIPERMEDCSYFMKGSCSNENCPYRHVNVNPESDVCKNFLRGYCAEGNECQKKHTYVCTAFEATGSCPKASSCKLHHPKNKIDKKRPPSEPNSIRGRYFDGGLIGDADVSDTSTERVSAKCTDAVGSNDGKFPDYISLGASDEEMEQSLASEDEDCRMDDSDFDFDVLV